MDVFIVSHDRAKLSKLFLKENSFYESRWLARDLPENKVAFPVNRRFIDAYLNDGLSNFSELNDIQFDVNVSELSRNLKKELKNPISKLISKLKGLEHWSEELTRDLPKSYEKFEDVLLINNDSFRMDIWQSKDLWDLVASSFNCKRICRKNAISKDIFRRPRVTMILGDSGIVKHCDNGIKYKYDITKCMFSPGNITEKLRVGKFDCSDETIVDLYGGIGYFTLPYLVHAKAKKVIACEWNPDAAEALRENLKLNKVSERCTVLEGDNRLTCPHNIADRINLGLIPSSEEGWKTACLALRKDTGGMMHVHGNVTSEKRENRPTKAKDFHNNDGQDKNFRVKYDFTKTTQKSEWNDWAHATSLKLKNIMEEIGHHGWNVSVLHVEHVKSYAPHIDHIVADIECKPSNN